MLQDPAVGGIVLNYRDVTEERDRSRRLHDVEQRRQALLESMVSAEARQRRADREELHDDTIQVMTAALIALDRVARHLRPANDGRPRRDLRRARRRSTKATERTRRLTFELRPPLLEAAGLPAAVRDLADAAARESGADVKRADDGRAVSGRIETSSTGRCRRRSQRPQARPRIEGRDRASRAPWQPDGRVRDDGRGFRTKRSPRAGRPTSGWIRRGSASGRYSAKETSTSPRRSARAPRIPAAAAGRHLRPGLQAPRPDAGLTSGRATRASRRCPARPRRACRAACSARSARRPRRCRSPPRCARRRDSRAEVGGARE